MPYESFEHLNFIDHYLLHNKRYESPNSFWLWCAYGAIAAVLRDSCYRRMGDNKLYPNIYILLLAGSSFDRKDRPPKFSESIVRAVANTKILSGYASIEGIIQELGRTETDSKTGKLIKGGSAVFFAPELSAAFVEDLKAVKRLTDIYDPKDNYETLLKTSASQNIKNLVFSMVAASNEELLKDVYSSKAVSGGLLARTFLIKSNEFRPPNSLLDLKEEDYKWIDASKKNLIEKLLCIGRLSGEMILSAGAQAVYNAWYNPFRKTQEKTRDKTGMLGRIHTSILKIAMILAAAEGKLELEEEHMQKSINDCLALVPNYSTFSMSANKSTIKDAGTMLFNDLIDAKDYCLTRTEIFQRHILEFDSIIFDNLIVTLEQAGMVTQVPDATGIKISYKLTTKAVSILKGTG